MSSLAVQEGTTLRGVERLGRCSRADVATVLGEASRKIEAKAVVDAMRRDETALAEQFTRTMEAELQGLGRHVATVAEPLLDDTRFMEKKWRTDLTNSEVQAIVEQIITASRLRDWAEQRLTPAFWKHYDKVQNTMGRTLIRAGIVTNLTQSKINSILRAGGRRAGLVDIVGQARTALFRVIEQGVDAGMSPRATAKLIRDWIPEGRFVNAGASYRASLIARTETLHAQRMSSLERYRSNRNVRMVMCFDGDHDEQCSSRNGAVMTIDDAWFEMSDTHPACVLAFGPIAV